METIIALLVGIVIGYAAGKFLKRFEAKENNSVKLGGKLPEKRKPEL